MKLVPLTYNLRSLWVRRSATLLTVLGIGATVAVLCGVLALQQGFERLFTENGRDDVIVFLRQGATNEGDSVFSRERAEILMKSLPEIERPVDAPPLVSAEIYLAVRRNKLNDAGETNVPIRGVQPRTFDIIGDKLHIIEGRNFKLGADEVIVGSKLVDRIRDCRVGDILQLNSTPFHVVGVFDHDGPFKSEIWGDRDRLAEALERPIFNRVIAKVRAGTDIAALRERMEEDPQVPCQVMTEREYFAKQTTAMSWVLRGLGFFLALIMGTAAVFTSTNTMLAALAARTREIGILLSLGFRPYAIFISILFESLVLGLVGGAVGCLLALPLNGVDTGTMNFQTFTEVAFAFRVTGQVMIIAVTFSLVLGLVGGTWPALRAAMMRPTHAMRHE
ncbi:MAG: ABC transporter permease [Planctomycetes bacterium]|nr:ABC transporter permease [Planctomycetota bacterium]